MRCLAAAVIYDGGKLSGLNENNKQELLTKFDKYNEYETGGCFLGIVGIKDPCRKECKPAIADCKTAGIRVIMITGDSKDTAVAIAKELDIIQEGQE